MSLKDTFEHMKDLLVKITIDLQKSEHGNKAASQRVRTGTVKLEKIAKLFRKESIVSEKKDKGHKKTSKSLSNAIVVKTKASNEAPAKSSPAAKTKVAAAIKAKAKPKTAQTGVKARQFSVKKATAKLPTKAKSVR